MSNFELFEQREYERKCSERISPRKTRNNKLLPPECHQTISSSCDERVSPRREKGVDCLDLLGSQQQQPVTSPNQRQSSSNGTRSFTVTPRNNGSNDRNGLNRRSSTAESVTPQTLPTERVTVTENNSVSSVDQEDIKKLQQEINKLQQEINNLTQEVDTLRKQVSEFQRFRRPQETQQRPRQPYRAPNFIVRNPPVVKQDRTRTVGVVVVDDSPNNNNYGAV